MLRGNVKFWTAARLTSGRARKCQALNGWRLLKGSIHLRTPVRTKCQGFGFSSAVSISLDLLESQQEIAAGCAAIDVTLFKIRERKNRPLHAIG